MFRVREAVTINFLKPFVATEKVSSECIVEDDSVPVDTQMMKSQITWVG